MGLDPEAYYDFDANTVKDFPPIPAELETKLKAIQKRTQKDLDRLERRGHDQADQGTVRGSRCY